MFRDKKIRLQMFPEYFQTLYLSDRTLHATSGITLQREEKKHPLL